MYVLGIPQTIKLCILLLKFCLPPPALFVLGNLKYHKVLSKIDHNDGAEPFERQVSFVKERLSVTCLLYF